MRDVQEVQHLTQNQMAQRLGIKQETVSRMEHRADMLISTMRSYIEAMGGSLQVIAEFPNRKPVSISFAELAGRPLTSKPKYKNLKLQKN